jgi:enoyl-CoA hydratase/carnithine racemase
MDYKHILLEIKNHIAWLTFNRPGQLNAMNAQMMDEIIRALGEVNVAGIGEVRVAVITGAGKAFMAGADIKEYAQQTQAEFEAFQTKGRNLYAAIEGNAKPVIAAINGYAFGGGLEIALACDMMVAAEGAKMGLPEIKLNLIPGGGGTQRLARKLGTNLANEMIMTGATVTAEEMLRHGLVNHIYPSDEFLEKVGAFASLFTDKEPDRLQAIKQLTRLGASTVDTAALSLENAALGRFYRSKEGQQKVQEFYRKSQEKSK